MTVATTSIGNLEWRRVERPGSKERYEADHIDGMDYVLYQLEVDTVPPVRCVFRDSGSSPLNYPEIYIGNSIDEAKDAANAHHRASHRQTLWRCYMRDNDPPTGSTP